jgi:hypothetical protein
MEVHRHAAQRAMTVRHTTVMVVLGAAIHVLLSRNKKIVDGRNNKSDHDNLFAALLFP